MNSARELLEIVVKHWESDGQFCNWDSIMDDIKECLSQQELEQVEFWTVIDSAENNEPVYSASFKQACVDHINDAVNMEVEGAWSWVARQCHTIPPDAAKRIAELEKVCSGLSQDAIDGGFTVKGLQDYAKGLEAKLAKVMEPLSGNEIKSTATANEFAVAQYTAQSSRG